MQALLRFTLDLFGAPPATPRPAGRKNGNGRKPVEPASTAQTGFEEPKGPPAQEMRAQPAPENIADDNHSEPAQHVAVLPDLPTQSIEQAMAPVSSRHPQATREVLLGGVHVAYEFKRAKRRTIGFSVGPEGLAVRAPKWVPLYEVDKAVHEKSAWIVKKLKETRSRHERLEAARITWRDGVVIPFLGQPVRVVLDPRHAFGVVGAELKPLEPLEPLDADASQSPADSQAALHVLHVGLPHHASESQIRDAVQAWLMRQAKRLFAERLDHFAPTLGVTWRRLSLSSAGTRWGSARADGAIRLNWRLVHFRQSVIDYVVVHELSHLRVMDHSPRFWDTVRGVVPDYAALRGELKDDAIPRW
jgi:predicted metal-dependent hydrolase